MPSSIAPGHAPSDMLSVSELTAQIKQLLEQGFSRVKVSGEVSRLTARSGGHIYFTIKDANASLSAVIWKSTALRLRVRPEEGRQYIFHGHLSLYPPQGRYQLIVSRLEEEGSGALAAEFERRKRLFAERGWFDARRKLTIPPLPRHIGIVTSETAAALQDVRKVLSTRPGWLRLTLSPSPVQGQAAASGIARALTRLQAMAEPPDVILLVRGGGSPEDLWCFNDEQVVRAIVECGIPVISGIGHEIDISLADYAADRQAATPSNAAETACPDSDSLRRQMPRIGLLRQLVQHRLGHARQSAAQSAAVLQHRWQSARDEHRMHIERLRHQSLTQSRQLQRDRRQQLRQLERRLQPLEPGQLLRMRQRRLDDSMKHLLAAAQSQTRHAGAGLDACRQSLGHARDALTRSRRSRLEQRSSQLHALGPLGVLRRGYALARTADGRVLHSIHDTGPGEALNIRLHDGTADTQVIHTQTDGDTP